MRNGLCAGWTVLLVSAAFCGGLVQAQTARPPATKASPATSDAEIRQVIAAYQEAFQSADPDAVAAFWTADADYVDYQGRAFKVTELLARAKGVMPDDGHLAPPALDPKTLTTRFVTPEVVIEDGVIERQGADAEKSQRRRFSAVWVKRAGKWLIDGVRESPYRAPVGDRFSDLDWMIGQWVAEGPHATAEASCAWGPGKSYILRQVTVTPKGAEPISATQWIGWDPIHERIRSFVFDSHGGYGDGIWEREGDAWVVTATGVLPDGRHTKVTNLYSQIDENTALWESVDEEIDGHPGVDLRLRATRKPANKH